MIHELNGVVYNDLLALEGQKPSWRSWLARQSHNLKVVSSSLTEGIFHFFRMPLELNVWSTDP